jgi:hypothetical protein
MDSHKYSTQVDSKPLPQVGHDPNDWIKAGAVVILVMPRDGGHIIVCNAIPDRAIHANFRRIFESDIQGYREAS